MTRLEPMFQDLEFGVFVGISHIDAEQESVELAIWEWKSAREIDGILSGDDHKRRGQIARDAVDGDAFFEHCLE